MSEIRFCSFPKTSPSPKFINNLVDVFRKHEPEISTIQLKKGLKSNPVLKVLKRNLEDIGFQCESGKKAGQILARPVYFGENGEPSLRYEIDAYSLRDKCGLEIEAGRATMGNAIFRDFFQAMIMVDVEHLCIAVPNQYKYVSKNKPMVSRDYEKTISVADALYGHSRAHLPYGLTVIGY